MGASNQHPLQAVGESINLQSMVVRMAEFIAAKKLTKSDFADLFSAALDVAFVAARQGLDQTIPTFLRPLVDGTMGIAARKVEEVMNKLLDEAKFADEPVPAGNQAAPSRNQAPAPSGDNAA